MSYNQPNTSDTANSYILESGQRVAVIVTGLIGTISTTCVSILLVHLFTVSFLSGRVNANKDERIFLRMHLGAFVVCLLCSDLVQGISGIMQLEWARRREVAAGPLCTAQAAMLLFGDNGTAFWNAVIGIHTFSTVVLRKRMSTVVVAFLIAAGWTMCVILTVIGPVAIQTKERGPFYSIAGAWCFVTTEYRDSRIYLHYIPMLISGFIITILYALVALVLFGILVIDGKRWHFKAPRTSGIRDLFGQFSWGRIGRGNNTSGAQTQSMHSSGIKSLTGRLHTGSIRLASVGRKSSEVKRTVTEDAAVTIQTIDISAPKPRPESNSTMDSPSMERERGRSMESKTLGGDSKHVGLTKEGKVDVKVTPVTAPAAAPGQNQNVTQVSGKGVPLKQLAIKMLWYPIVYLLLVMPITISRVDITLDVSLNVMLGFMCLLWSMGTANTIIYVCTRRLGPNPWSRRQLSISRSRSKTTRKAEPSPPHGAVQIRVDQFTQHATDEQILPNLREKGVRTSLTGAEISILDPAPASSPGAQKVGFEFTNAFPPSTHHILQQQQQRQSTQTHSTGATFSPPISPLEPAFQMAHPYSRVQSPQSLQSHDARVQYPPYYVDNDDESFRTHSRGGSLSAPGMAF